MKNKSLLLLLLIIQHIFFGCQNINKQPNQDNLNSNKIKTLNMEIEKKLFGKIHDNIPVYSFTLRNSNGMEVEILEFGAIVVGINVPDKNGNIADVVLGYSTLKEYQDDPYYFGATIGRVANRTAGARFSIDRQTYKLAPNTLPDFGHNSLHGGVKGFNKVFWKGKSFKNENEIGVKLTYLSPDGEEGYPGNANCIVNYTLNDDGELGIEMEATTDKTTILNLTHHSYFNLTGAGNGDILDTRIMVNADNYTPADDDLIPTGEIAKVKGLPVDFSTSRTISSQIDDMQKAKFKGYDLNYVLNHTEKGLLELAAKAIDTASGRLLEVFTTQPCMHFYTSNFLEGKPGKNGKTYEQYGAFCFEPQGYPDAANKPQFEPIKLKPGENYKQTIIYKFSTVE